MARAVQSWISKKHPPTGRGQPLDGAQFERASICCERRAGRPSSSSGHPLASPSEVCASWPPRAAAPSCRR
eukprot:11246185-Alexandrium_andersonii.AAC.1